MSPLPDFSKFSLPEGVALEQESNNQPPDPASTIPAANTTTAPDSGLNTPAKPDKELLIENQQQQQEAGQQQQQQQAPQFNEEEIISKILGTGHSYKSIAELEQLRIGERLSELDKLKNEHVSAKKELEKYKGRAALTETPQFLSATKYSNFAKEAGVEVDYGTFCKLEKFDPKEMSDEDALVLLDYIKFGENGRTKDRINYQFKLGDYAPEVEDDDGNKSRKENAFDRQDMKREAAIAKKELSQYRDKIAAFKPEFNDNAAGEKESNLQAWRENGAVEKMVPFFKELDIPVKEIKGIKIDAAYQFTPEDHEMIKTLLTQEVEASGLPLTKENVEAVYGSVMQKMLLHTEQKRFEIFADKIYSNIDMALKARFSNYKGLDFVPERRAPQESTKKPGEIETAQDVIEAVKQAQKRR